MPREAMVAAFDGCTKIMLEVEIAKDSYTASRKFNAEYLKNSNGDSPFRFASGMEHYLRHDQRAGFEARIYFSGPDTVKTALSQTFNVEDSSEGPFVPCGIKFAYREEYNFRVSNNSLFFKLVKDGYRLGVNEGRVPSLVTQPTAAAAVPTPTPTTGVVAA